MMIRIIRADNHESRISATGMSSTITRCKSFFEVSYNVKIAIFEIRIYEVYLIVCPYIVIPRNRARLGCRILPPNRNDLDVTALPFRQGTNRKI